MNTNTNTNTSIYIDGNNTTMQNSIYTTQNSLLLNNLLKFYAQDDNMDYMLRIINGESKISLRIIDWFATNYAKKYYTLYSIHNTGRRFKVYVDYKLKLKAYSKKRFDPFCRWDRINVPYKGDKYIQTTIGQLNFFKWALENDVIRYVEENYANIEKDMNNRNSNAKKNSMCSSIASEMSMASTTSLSSEGDGGDGGGGGYDGCGGGDGGGEGGGGYDGGGVDISDGTMTQTTSSSIVSSETNNKTRKKREELSISATKSIKKEKVEIVVNFN
jgi:uncharacterized membrane protein YgcG